MITQVPCASCRTITSWSHQEDPRVPTPPPPLLCVDCAARPSSFTCRNGMVCYAGFPQSQGRVLAWVPRDLFLLTCDSSGHDGGDADIVR